MNAFMTRMGIPEDVQRRALALGALQALADLASAGDARAMARLRREWEKAEAYMAKTKKGGRKC